MDTAYHQSHRNSPSGGKRASGVSATVSALPLVTLLLALLVSVPAHRPLWVALAFAYAAAFGVSLATGWTAGAIIKFSVSGLKKVLKVILLLGLINTAIAIWLGCGSIQSMVYYGLRTVGPAELPVASFLTSAAVSLFLGSALGTLSTVGVAAMAMARASGVRPEIVAGALLSGSLLGDRLSPVSPIFHAATEVTGASQERVWRKAAAVEGPAWILALSFYLVTQARVRLEDPSRITGYRAFLETMTSAWSPSLLGCVPPFLVLVLTALRVPVLWSLLSGIVAGTGLGLSKGARWTAVLSWVVRGFSPLTGSAELDRAFAGGGLAKATGVILLLGFAGMFNGIMEGTGMFHHLMTPLVRKLHTRKQALLGTVELSIASACVMSNQLMSVLVPCEMTRDLRAELGIDPETASATVLGSGGVVSPLIPWNVMGMMASEALGLPTWAFAPFAFYVFLTLTGTALAAVLGGRNSPGTRYGSVPRDFSARKRCVDG